MSDEPGRNLENERNLENQRNLDRNLENQDFEGHRLTAADTEAGTDDAERTIDRVTAQDEGDDADFEAHRLLDASERNLRNL
jgi:hypothetical protein